MDHSKAGPGLEADRGSEFIAAGKVLGLGLLFLLGGLLLMALVAYAYPAWLSICLGATVVYLFLVILFHSLVTGGLEERVVYLLFVSGQVLCWVFGALTCVYVLQPYGFHFGDHPAVTQVLLILFMLGGISGSNLIEMALPKRKSEELFKPPSVLHLQQSLLIFGIVWGGIQFLGFMGGAFSARWETGNSLNPGSSIYFISALSNMSFPFFFFLGASCKRPVSNPGNVIWFLLLLLGMIFLGLQGGRETGIRAGVYFMLGLFYTRIPLKAIMGMSVAAVLVALIYIFAIGKARTSEEFASGGATSRMVIIVDAVTDGDQGKSFADKYLLRLFSRIAEPSGQKVIDDVYKTGEYLGFINVDRVLYLYLPKFIYPNKPSLDDGWERLIAFHGFKDNKYSTAPITFLADGFERGGYCGVFFISLVYGMLFVALGRLVLLLPDPCLRSVLIVHFAVSGLRVYSFSALGTLNFLLYFFPKDALMITALMMASRLIFTQTKTLS